MPGKLKRTGIKLTAQYGRQVRKLMDDGPHIGLGEVIQPLAHTDSDPTGPLVLYGLTVVVCTKKYYPVQSLPQWAEWLHKSNIDLRIGKCRLEL